MTIHARVVLMDIEGTTSSIAFVYETLFPYARRALAAFVAADPDPDAQQAEREAFAVEALEDRKGGDETAILVPTSASADPDGRLLAARALQLMDQDRKSTPLKALQGRIWARGFADGALQGHVYPDVPPAMARWAAAGVRQAIYSSGSVAAQRLLFGHAQGGSLLGNLEAFFDTTTGGKKEAASYTKIAAALSVDPAAVLFLTDNLEEAVAARAAGMQVRLLMRPGNPPVGAHDVIACANFAELHVQPG